MGLKIPQVLGSSPACVTELFKHFCMPKDSSTTTSSVSLSTLVFIVFLVLKLANIGVVATWSWWWVTSPLWIPVLFVLGLFVVFVVVKLIASLF
jgi:hypothetical protein